MFKAALFLEGVSPHWIEPPFGVVTGCESPDISSHLPRWREVVVFVNECLSPPLQVLLIASWLQLFTKVVLASKVVHSMFMAVHDALPRAMVPREVQPPPSGSGYLVQGHLIYKETHPPKDPTVGLYLRY